MQRTALRSNTVSATWEGNVPDEELLIRAGQMTFRHWRSGLMRCRPPSTILKSRVSWPAVVRHHSSSKSRAFSKAANPSIWAGGSLDWPTSELIMKTEEEQAVHSGVDLEKKKDGRTREAVQLGREIRAANQNFLTALTLCLLCLLVFSVCVCVCRFHHFQYPHSGWVLRASCRERDALLLRNTLPEEAQVIFRCQFNGRR